MSKLAILNCDDFGMSSRINQGVLEAHNRGVLNSTTLLVNHRAAFEAAAIARDNPELGVGLHLDLEALFNFKASVYYGKSVSDVKSNTLALVLKQQSLIEDMIIEQVEKFKYLNLNMTHLDGHNHVHLFPGVFEIVVAQIQQ